MLRFDYNTIVSIICRHHTLMNLNVTISTAVFNKKYSVAAMSVYYSAVIVRRN